MSESVRAGSAATLWSTIQAADTRVERKAETGRGTRHGMNHDRIHARKPTHDIERWSTGVVAAVERRDGYCVVTVDADDGGTVELVVTVAIRDLFVSRLDIEDGDSPVGERVWYRKRGG